MAIDRTYDAINAALFLSAGGSRRVRGHLVDALDIRPGHRVLELGCGTGQVTQLLVEAGADVVAVDQQPEMLAGAYRRAPEATFVQGDVIGTDLGMGFDRVVLSFVLHNFRHFGRLALLRRAHTVLVDGGRVGVLDWSAPNGRVRERLWRRVLGWLEPSHAVPEILAGALEPEAEDVGFSVQQRRSVAGGRAEVMVFGAIA